MNNDEIQLESATQPKVTAVELVVHTSDGKVIRYNFAGTGGHRIEVALEYQPEPVGQPPWYQDRPIFWESSEAIATITAKAGMGTNDPLFRICVEEPA